MTDKTATVLKESENKNKVVIKTTFFYFRIVVSKLADIVTVNTHCTNKFWREIKNGTPVTPFYSSNAFGSKFYAKLVKTSALSAWPTSNEWRLD